MDRKKLLFGTRDKDHATVERFVTDLEVHGDDTENVTDTYLDMSKSFIKGIKENFPDAALTFDQCHLIKLMNDILVNIWAEEARQIPEELRKTRYIILKNPHRHTEDEEKKLFDLTRFSLGRIKAYMLKLPFQ